MGAKGLATSLVCVPLTSVSSAIAEPLDSFLMDYHAVMLSPRGQSGLEAKILASASASASKL